MRLPSVVQGLAARLDPASRVRASGRARLDQPPLDRVAGQLDAVSHPELLEDVGAMAIDRLLG